ncbi:MAG TPA: AMP-binding protein [Longimicrobium sp.]|jgi:acyl-CoA synthetase (AMP-forming)/AMP-acid ligase II
MDPRTHQGSLLAWLDDPAPDRGIHFARPDGGWSFCAYQALAGMAREAAAGLLRRGVRAGQVVALVGRAGPELAAAFFGALRVGAVPAVLAPPAAFQDPESYRETARRALAVGRPALAVVDDELLEGLARLLEGEARTVGFAALLEGGRGQAPPAPAPPGELALLQFTSGSSGTARAVRVPRSALEANVAAIGKWLGWTPETPFASWLPLHHDMGLVGGLVSPVVNRCDLWLLQPEQFIRDPLRWLRCLGAAGARLSATPAFGLDVVVRKVAPGALEGLDFSGVQGIVVGAERISADTLERFHRLLAPHGLRREAVLPAYGLAEATLAVSGLPRGEGWTTLAVERASLAPGRRVRLAGPGAEGAAVVGCGVPLDSVEVSVAGEGGAPLGEGSVGEIVVRGASLAAGYLGAPAPSPAAPADGGLRTGDAGFLWEGQLFVLGRLGDSLKVRGRVVFSEDLEVALAGVGVPPSRTAVLLGVHEGAPTAVLLAEEPAPQWRGAAEALLRREAGGARVAFVGVPRGAILRTTSGKPRRRPLWAWYVAGGLPGAAGRGGGARDLRGEDVDG